MDSSTAKPIQHAPKQNVGLFDLIRAKREWCWKPSIEELRKGFRGWHQRGYLPHFDAPYVTQFVTFTLADSLPAACGAEWQPIDHDPDGSSKRKQLERWLDHGHGECWLRRQEVAKLVEELLLAGNGNDYQMKGWVIMPNHVHVVVGVWDVPLAKLVFTWKGKSARLANAFLGRSGEFWKKDYFDTLIRDETHLGKAIRYIEHNPAKAFLVKAPRDWPWSSARLRDGYERLPWEHGQ